MIDTGPQYVELLPGHLHDARDVASPHENAVAKTERPDRAVFAQREDNAALGIGKIDEQCVRAKLLHLTNEIEHQWQSPQGEHQPAWTAVLAQRMADTVFARHLPVELPKPIAIDSCRVDNEA